MRLSSSFKSADGRVLYAVDEKTGARRRVQWDGPKLVLRRRLTKAQKKAASRAEVRKLRAAR